MKKKKGNKKEIAYSYLNQFQILKLWKKNKLTREVPKGRYVFKPNYGLEYMGETLCYKVKNKILLRNFDNVGVFGNGLAAWHITVHVLAMLPILKNKCST